MLFFNGFTHFSKLTYPIALNVFLTIQQKSQLKNNRRNRQSEQIEDNFLLKKKPDKTDNKCKKNVIIRHIDKNKQSAAVKREKKCILLVFN